MSITILNPGMLTSVQDLGRIGYQQYDGSLAYPIVRSLDTHAFERVVGFADTCRIDEAERQSV